MFKSDYDTDVISSDIRARMELSISGQSNSIIVAIYGMIIIIGLMMLPKPYAIALMNASRTIPGKSIIIMIGLSLLGITIYYIAEPALILKKKENVILYLKAFIASSTRIQEILADQKITDYEKNWNELPIPTRGKLITDAYQAVKAANHNDEVTIEEAMNFIITTDFQYHELPWWFFKYAVIRPALYYFEENKIKAYEYYIALLEES